MELETMTALELAAKIKQRQIHVVDGVKAVFDQIESKEETVHAYLDLYKKEAYARAKEVEKGIADGIYTGPLAGVPIAIKDNICIKVSGYSPLLPIPGYFQGSLRFSQFLQY